MVYSGDTNYLSAASAAMTQTVNAKTATVTTVTSTLNPAYVTSAVAFIATVIGHGDRNSAVPGWNHGPGHRNSCEWLDVIQHVHARTRDPFDHRSLRRRRRGCRIHLVSALPNHENIRRKTVGLIPFPAVVGQTVKITANMASAATGTVQFTDGSTVLATVQVASGTASYSTSSLAQGSHTLGVAYSGDATYMSVSTTFAETVLAASAIGLSSNLNPSVVGQSVTFTASVTPVWRRERCSS